MKHNTAERDTNSHSTPRLKIMQMKNPHADLSVGISERLFLSWYNWSLNNSYTCTETKVEDMT